MRKYYKDTLTALVCFFVVLILNFLLPRLLPGDPIAYLTGFSEEEMTVKQIENYRMALHLDDSIPVQFLHYLKSIADGRLGYSFKKEAYVITLIGARLASTLQITLPAVIITSGLALLLGLRSGMKKGGLTDRMLTPSLVLLNTIPSFLIGIVLLIILAFRFRLFPYTGLSSAGIPKNSPAYFFDRIRHLFLPVMTLVLTQLPSRYLLVRNLAATVSDSKYILYAKTRGLGRRRVMFSHILPNIAPPFINMVGLSVGSTIGGAMVIENLFSISGMGTLLTDAVYSLDYPLIGGILFVTTAFMTLSVIAADGLCLLAAPNARRKK